MRSFVKETSVDEAVVLSGAKVVMEGNCPRLSSWRIIIDWPLQSTKRQWRKTFRSPKAWNRLPKSHRKNGIRILRCFWSKQKRRLPKKSSKLKQKCWKRNCWQTRRAWAEKRNWDAQVSHWWAAIEGRRKAFGTGSRGAQKESRNRTKDHEFNVWLIAWAGCKKTLISPIFASTDLYADSSPL